MALRQDGQQEDSDLLIGLLANVHGSVNVSARFFPFDLPRRDLDALALAAVVVLNREKFASQNYCHSVKTDHDATASPHREQGADAEPSWFRDERGLGLSRMTSRESDFDVVCNPEEMNAHVGSNRLCNEQSIRREDERDSPSTRGLRMNVIWAND